MGTNQTTSITNATDIRDIAPPLDIPSGYEWLWWALATLAIMVVTIVLWRWLRKRAAQVPIVPVIPAHLRAKQKLQEALALIAQPKPFVVVVSDTLRLYLEERFNFRAPERTTEEFLNDLQRTDRLIRDQKDSLGQFLTNCDLVKFAKYEPGEPELRDLHASAVRLIEETEPPTSEATAAIAFSSHETKGETIQPPPKQARTPRGKNFAIIGTWLQLGPSIWIAAYFIMLYRLLFLAKETPQSTSRNGVDAILSLYSRTLDIYSHTLILVCVGLLAGLVGLVLLTISLVSFRYRAEWFFWFLIIYGIVLLGAFPCFGTAIGIFFIVYSLTYRREFFSRS